MHIRRRYIWVALNGAGAVSYLWLASSLWVLPGEEGTPGGPGDAFYWLFFLVPVLGIYAALNIAALIAIARRARRGTAVRSEATWWFVVSLSWAAAVGYDHYRSVRYIDKQYSGAGPLMVAMGSAPGVTPNLPLDTDAQGRPLPSVAPFLGRRSSLR